MRQSILLSTLISEHAFCRFWTGLLLIAFVFGAISTETGYCEYRNDIGVRALGMGGAFASIADDPTGVFWNPSGIADIKDREFVYDLSQGVFSAAASVGRFGSIGLSLVDLNYTDRFLIDSTFNPFGMFLTGDNQFLLSYAKRFQSGVALGTNIGYNKAADPDSQWAINLDFGVDVELRPWLNAGVGIRDIRGTRILDDDGDLIRKFDRQFLFGLHLRPHRFIRLDAALNPDRRTLSGGAELDFDLVSLRGGIIQEIDSIPSTPPKWTAGLSLNFHGKKINYAYVSDVDMIYQHLLSVQLEFPAPTIRRSNSITSNTGVDDLEVGSEILTNPKPREVEIVRNPTITVEDATSIKDKPVQPLNKRIKPIDPSPPIVDPPLADVDEEETEKDDDQKNQPEIGGEFLKTVKKFEIDPMLALAIINVESAFDPDAVSPVGAVGLMQLMPGTASDLGLKVPNYRNPKLPVRNPKVDERFDPQKNLEAGLKYFSQLLKRHKGNYVLALCAYNSGPGSVEEDVPRIRQTERFAAKVMKSYYDYKHDEEKMKTALARVERILSGE